MKTKTELHPLLVTVRDALPERIRARVSKIDVQGEYMDIPFVGWIEVIYDDKRKRKPKPKAIQLHFRGIYVGRSRRYLIRKDGTLNLTKLGKTIEPFFDKAQKRHDDYTARQTKREAIFAEAGRLGPIVFKKVRTGRRYQKKDHESYAGGFRLIHRKSKQEAEVWAISEDAVSGSIPFGNLPISKLNEILKLMGR